MKLQQWQPQWNWNCNNDSHNEIETINSHDDITTIIATMKLKQQQQQWNHNNHSNNEITTTMTQPMNGCAIPVE